MHGVDRELGDPLIGGVTLSLHPSWGVLAPGDAPLGLGDHIDQPCRQLYGWVCLPGERPLYGFPHRPRGAGACGLTRARLVCSASGDLGDHGFLSQKLVQRGWPNLPLPSSPELGKQAVMRCFYLQGPGAPSLPCPTAGILSEEKMGLGGFGLAQADCSGGSSAATLGLIPVALLNRWPARGRAFGQLTALERGRCQRRFMGAA